ncbi:hypothetical protein [Aeromonas caviae]|uniref:hypothetical protein n=1 Tax=Aeromonas caviae TaxID=648 RepID=UPI0038D0DC1D
MNLYHPTNPGLVDPTAVNDLMARTKSGKSGKSGNSGPELTFDPTLIKDNPLPFVGEKDEPDFLGEVVPAAFKANNLTMGIYSRVTDTTYDPQAGYDPLKDEAVYQGIPEDYHDQLFDSKSPAESQAIRGRILAQMEHQQTLADAGWVGTAAGLVASVADPATVIPGAGVFGAAAKALRTASRAKNAAIGAGIGVAEAAAYNEVAMSTNQMSGNDQLINLTMGMAGGAFFGSMMSPVRASIDNKAARDAAAQTVAEMDAKAADDALATGQEYTAPVFTAKSKRELNELRMAASKSPEAKAELDAYNLRALAESSKQSTEFTDDLVASSAGLMRELEALSAKQAGALVNPAPATIKALDTHMPAPGAGLGGRKAAGAAPAANRYQGRDGLVPMSERAKEYDAYAQERAAELDARVAELGEKTVPMKMLTPYSRQLLETGAPAARAFVADMLEVPTGALTNENAAIHRSTLVNKYDVASLAPYQEGFKKHRRLAGKQDDTASWVQKNWRGDYRADYDRQVYQEMLNRNNAWREGRAYQSTAPEHIQKAADGIDSNMRMAREDMIQYGLIDDSMPEQPGYLPRKWDWEKIASLTEPMRKELTDLLTDAYRATGIPAEVAAKIARNMIVRASGNVGQIDANIFNQLDAKSTAELTTFLQEAGVDADAIGSLLDTIQKQNAKKSAPGMLNRRTALDLTMASQNFQLIDFVDTNIERVTRTYNVETSGRVALAAKGIYSRADWDDVTAAVKNDIHRSNPNADLEDTHRALEDAWESFTGVAVRGGINRVAGRMMAATQISLLGGMGLAQSVEMANILGRHGVNGIMRSMSSIGEVAGIARRDPNSPLLKSIAAAGGPLWDNAKLHSPDVRLDWHGTVGTQAGKIIDRALAIGQGTLATVSALRRITSLERRLATVLEMDALVRMANEGVPTDAKKLRRLTAMGIEFGSGGNWDSIAEALRLHGKYDSKGVLTDIDFDSMAPGTRDDILFIIKRSVGQQIQEAYIGETPTALNSTLGKLMGQFKSYPLLSMDKQIARNIQIGDMEAYHTFMWGLMLGAAVAPVRMALAGRSEEINAGTIAAQAVRYMPMSGVWSDALDVMSSIGIVPPRWTLSNWGQEQERRPELWDIFAPVGIQYAKKAADAVGVITERASPWNDTEELSASDIRALRGAAPLGSLPGIAGATSLMFPANSN